MRVLGGTQGAGPRLFGTLVLPLVPAVRGEPRQGMRDVKRVSQLTTAVCLSRFDQSMNELLIVGMPFLGIMIDHDQHAPIRNLSLRGRANLASETEVEEQRPNRRGEDNCEPRANAVARRPGPILIYYLL
jgi:hypothetical protein